MNYIMLGLISFISFLVGFWYGGWKWQHDYVRWAQEQAKIWPYKDKK